jgi:hypothetical protein
MLLPLDEMVVDVDDDSWFCCYGSTPKYIVVSKFILLSLEKEKAVVKKIVPHRQSSKD